MIQITSSLQHVYRLDNMLRHHTNMYKIYMCVSALECPILYRYNKIWMTFAQCYEYILAHQIMVEAMCPILRNYRYPISYEKFGD